MKSDEWIIFLDIDGTLIRPKKQLSEQKTFNVWFREWLHAHGVEDTETWQQKIEEGGILDEVVIFLGLSLDDLREDLKEWAAQRFEAIEGAADLLQSAHQRAREVHLASTNASIMAFAKIAGAGLDVSLLTGLRGGNEVLSGGKSSPEFFCRLVQWVEAPAKRVLHIGDHPTADAVFSLDAGVGFCLLLQSDVPVSLTNPLNMERVKVCRGPLEAARWLDNWDGRTPAGASLKQNPQEFRYP